MRRDRCYWWKISRLLCDSAPLQLCISVSLRQQSSLTLAAEHFNAETQRRRDTEAQRHRDQSLFCDFVGGTFIVHDFNRHEVGRLFGDAIKSTRRKSLLVSFTETL